MLRAAWIVVAAILINQTLAQDPAMTQDPADELEDALSDWIAEKITPVKDQLVRLQTSLGKLQRQVMDHQLGLEEKARTDGKSGLKQNRVEFGGYRPYHREHYSGRRLATMHDHGDHELTMGLGEFVAVLNGVQFTTRHNDYDLNMPDWNNPEFLASVPVPFPDVPPSVLAQPTVQDQILEMREYFRAWKDLNSTHRDFGPYFKPVMVYLEGWWATNNEDLRDFQSSRHTFNANSWYDLWQKYKFTQDAGRKQRKENLAYLPTRLYNPNGCEDPENTDICALDLAQWNYRIMAYPIPFTMQHNRLRLVHDDLVTQVGRLGSFDAEKLYRHKAARFQIHPDNAKWTGDEEETAVETWDTLDKIFAYIPGLDNAGNAPDNAFDRETFRFNNPSRQLNAMRYHRKYLEDTQGAMGVTHRWRFFSDDQLFMAMNSQDAVAPTCLNNNCASCDKPCICQRWSYAIPLEIVYLTPLKNWNPYGIYNHGNVNGKGTGIPGAGGRNGGFTPDTAFNGSDANHYFFTPTEFYGDITTYSQDAADTSKVLEVGVLDSDGIVRKVAPSGHVRMIPDIPGVGSLRQRFPVAPIHPEGHALGKELRALQDVVLDWKENKNHYREDLGCGLV